MSHSRLRAQRAGFTLVELLVVITIIGILAGLLTVGIMAAYNSAKSFTLGNEITQIAASLEQFKTKYGCYPPDMSDVSNPNILPGNNQVTAANLASFPYFNAFISKAYPRADRTAIAAFCNRVRFGGAQMDQAEALAFFLGGTSKDPRYPLGKLLNPANPPDSANYAPPQPAEVDVFYEFPAGSLLDGDGDLIPEFSQKGAKGAPLVYFDARTYTSIPVASIAAGQVQVGFQNSGYPNAGVATPYSTGIDTSVNPNRFVFFNPKSYQLVCAGQDGEFGVFLTPGTPAYPILNPTAAIALPRVPESDGDNIANFSSGRTINSFTAQ